jgi:predicted component of type VI protein secretion system
MARLIVNPRTPQAYEIQLKPGENYIGRGFANDFKLEDPSVSGSHCQLMVNGGAVLLRDLGSTNGTYVNRSQIKEASLLPGQVIRIGAVEMVFESGGKSATRPIPAAAAVPVAVALPVATPVPLAAPVPAAARAAGPPVPVAALLAAPLVQTVHAPVAARVAVISNAPSPPPPSNFRPSGGTTVVLAATPVPVPVADAHAPAPRPALPPEPVPTAVAPEGKTACKFHPNTAGRFFCPQCNNLFCSLCVASKKITTGTSSFCRPCGVEGASVRVHVVPPQS